ncbi:cell division protein FtsB [Dokdonia sp. Hel_I_53]|nr:cell division protein FtsB [Dokdonia sp. Hel_I_53]
MGLKELKAKKWFKILSNKYLLIFLIFIVWMFFFDGSSWLLHRELNQEIKKLEGNRDYFQNEISTDKEQIEQLQDSAGLERFAREEYLMKKDNEEIYIIEYQDSIIKNNNE